MFVFIFFAGTRASDGFFMTAAVAEEGLRSRDLLKGNIRGKTKRIKVVHQKSLLF